jgi:hypothetical protein
MTLADSDAALDALVIEGFALDRDHAREIVGGGGVPGKEAASVASLGYPQSEAVALVGKPANESDVRRSGRSAIK